MDIAFRCRRVVSEWEVFDLESFQNDTSLYICIYIYIYLLFNMYILIYACMCSYMCVCVYRHISRHICSMYMYTYTCKDYIHVCVRARTRPYMDLYIFMYLCLDS